MKQYKKTLRKYRKNNTFKKKHFKKKTRNLKRHRKKKTKHFKRVKVNAFGGDDYDFSELIENLKGYVPHSLPLVIPQYMGKIAGKSYIVNSNYIGTKTMQYDQMSKTKYLLFIRHAEKFTTISAPLTEKGRNQASNYGKALQGLKHTFNNIFCTSVLFRSMQTAIEIQKGMGNEENILPLNYFRERGWGETHTSYIPTYDKPTGFYNLPNTKGYEDVHKIIQPAIWSAYKSLDTRHYTILQGIQGLNISDIKETDKDSFSREIFDSSFRPDTMITSCQSETSTPATDCYQHHVDCCIKKKLESIINTIYSDDSNIIFYPIVSHGSLMRDIYKEISGFQCVKTCSDFMWSFVLPFIKSEDGTIVFKPPELVFKGLT